MRPRVFAGLQEVLTLTHRPSSDGATHWSAGSHGAGSGRSIV